MPIAEYSGAVARASTTRRMHSTQLPRRTAVKFWRSNRSPEGGRGSNNKEINMRPSRHGSPVGEFPSDLEIVTTREFDAPIGLVYDVLTKPEHVFKWFAPFEDKMTVCSIDLRVGGDYHMVVVTPDGEECSF